MEIDRDEEEDQQTLLTTKEDYKDGKAKDKVLVKDDSYIVTERKGLPVEIQQAISLAGEKSCLSTF
jgi:hypothetical protein